MHSRLKFLHQFILVMEGRIRIREAELWLCPLVCSRSLGKEKPPGKRLRYIGKVLGLISL